MFTVLNSFWHAQCIVDSLEFCRSVAHVDTTTTESPKNLDTVHYNLLRRVDERGEDVRLIVSRAVRWLGGALRPMSLSQIIEAVQIELGRTPPLSLNDDLSVVTPDDMLMLCGDLIKMDERTARLGLGHPTVRVRIPTRFRRDAISCLACRPSSLSQSPRMRSCLGISSIPVLYTGISLCARSHTSWQMTSKRPSTGHICNRTCLTFPDGTSSLTVVPC